MYLYMLIYIVSLLLMFGGYFIYDPYKINKTHDYLNKNKKELEENEDKMIRQRYKYNKIKDIHWDAILVGSGPSSMACASSLSQMGKKCLILEQNEQLGGGAHTWSKNGYEFETGIHYLGNDPEMFQMIKFLSHNEIKFSDIGTNVYDNVLYDNIIIGNEHYPFYSGKDNLIKMLKEKFPDEHCRIDKFFVLFDRYTSVNVKNQSRLFFIIKSSFYLINGWIKQLLIKILCPDYYYFVSHTIKDILEDCDIKISSRLGSVLLGQYGDYGLTPDKITAMIHFGVMAHYINGSVYPDGGSGTLVKKLNNVVIAGGGNSFVNACVSSFIINEDKCAGVVVNGDKIYGDNIISSIGVYKSYYLITKTNINYKIETIKNNIEKHRILSTSFNFMFVSLELPEGVKDTSSHNSWIYPQDDFIDMENKINNNEPWSRPMPMFVASGSEKDKIWKYKNKKTIVVLSNTPWSWVEKWSHLNKKERKNNVEYQKYKKLCQDKMMEQGFMKIYPHLKDYIKYIEIGTPLSTNEYLSTINGECYGEGMTPTKMLNNNYNSITPIKNLYVTGQDVITIGYTGSIFAGYLTANIICGNTYIHRLLMGHEIMKNI